MAGLWQKLFGPRGKVNPATATESTRRPARLQSQHWAGGGEGRGETLENFLLAVFTVVMAAFLFCGGIYLINEGSDHHVVDFIVLGGMGVFMGVTVAAVGGVTVFLPIINKSSYDVDSKNNQPDAVEKMAEVTPAYFTAHQVSDLTAEIGTKGGRRPSATDVYGAGDATEIVPPRKTPPPRPPPPVVLPEAVAQNNGVTHQLTSTVSLKSRPTTATDIEYIAKVANDCGVVSGQKGSSSNTNAYTADPEDSTVEISVCNNLDVADSDSGKPNLPSLEKESTVSPPESPPPHTSAPEAYSSAGSEWAEIEALPGGRETSAHRKDRQQQRHATAGGHCCQ